MLFEAPFRDAMLDAKGFASATWRRWYDRIYRELLPPNGTTANRPTALATGQFFFDTTLNKPIWVKTVSPLVWVDATGTSV